MTILGYISSFLDNEAYGAEDVSRVFSYLVSSGTVAYPTDLTVAQSLDAMTAEITSDGVSEYGGLCVTKTADDIKIGPGVGFFPSGVSVEVDSDGVTLPAPGEGEVYVYFIYEREFNRVRADATELLPEGEVLLLARVSADGGIIDERSYASCKIIPNTSNYYHDFTVTNSAFGRYEDRNDNNTTYYEMPHSGFKYLILQDVQAYPMHIEAYRNVIDLTLGEEQAICIASGYGEYIRVLKIGNTLRIASTSTTGLSYANTLYITLI